MNADPVVLALRRWMEVFMRRSVHNLILFARQHNISMTQMGALFHLHRHGSCGVSEFGEELGVSNAAVSQMLEKLVQQGLIERLEAVHDRRARIIMMSEKGRELLADGIRARQEWMEGIANGLTPAEKEKVVGALEILIEKAALLDNLSENERKSQVCYD